MADVPDQARHAPARILVIDDEPLWQHAIEAILRPDGHHLEFAGSGREGLAACERARFDLVICDVLLPDLDGFAVCRALKTHDEGQYVPVILFSGLAERADLVHGLEAGADLFVTKPVDGAVLRAKVRAMLRVRSRYDLLRTGMPPSVDRRHSVLSRAGLTPREREVLELVLLGRAHSDIASALGISERTSKFHQANLFAKLGVESRLDLLRVLL